VFSYFKDTIWNQFTTVFNEMAEIDLVCLVISKIQSGINSQPKSTTSPSRESVFSYFKDTIWNQFTTAEPFESIEGKVCLVISKIQSGINSQLRLSRVQVTIKCV